MWTQVILFMFNCLKLNFIFLSIDRYTTDLIKIKRVIFSTNYLSLIKQKLLCATLISCFKKTSIYCSSSKQTLLWVTNISQWNPNNSGFGRFISVPYNCIFYLNIVRRKVNRNSKKKLNYSQKNDILACKIRFCNNFNKLFLVFKNLDITINSWFKNNIWYI